VIRLYLLEDTTMRRYTIGLLVILTLGLFVAPRTADAQPRGKMPVLGIFYAGFPSALTDPKNSLYAFRQGLRDLGYREGQDIILLLRVFRHAKGTAFRRAGEIQRRVPEAGG
jgi:hypothetical protein